jgi:hypothetical protein
VIVSGDVPWSGVLTFFFLGGLFLISTVIGGRKRRREAPESEPEMRTHYHLLLFVSWFLIGLGLLFLVFGMFGIASD